MQTSRTVIGISVALAGVLLILLLVSLLSRSTILDGMGEDWTRAAIGDSQAKGERIMDAIAAYVAAEGEPPASLDALVPDYLEHVPMPSAGNRQWSYWRKEDDCGLAFGCGEHFYPNYELRLAYVEDGWLLDN